MTRADIFLLGFKNMPREGHTVHVQTEVSHRTAESIGILVTLQIHNLHLKKKKKKYNAKISLRRGEDSHT